MLSGLVRPDVRLKRAGSWQLEAGSFGGLTMKVYDAPAIRNVALVGHSGAGKTQLISALLFDAGAVNRFGRVDDGTTVTDYDEEEIARKHTLSCSLAYVEWNKHKINFIDTPGMANFLSDARAALRVVGCRARRRRCGRRRRSLDRESLGSGRRARAAAPRRAQPARSRAREPGSIARVAARGVRPRGRPDAAADRRREVVPRRRRSRRDEGLDVRRPTAAAKPSEGAIPGRSRGAGAGGARGADRDGRRSRRLADGEVLRRRAR